MIDENKVVEAVCSALRDKGYSIVQQLTTLQKGTDIIATHPLNGRIYIEAKGATSGDTTSKRYGQPFDRKQVYDVVAKGSYAVFRLHWQKAQETNAHFAIAVPDSLVFQEHLAPLIPLFKHLGIHVILVSEEGFANFDAYTDVV